MKYFILMITFLSLGCTTTSQHTKEVGQKYHIEECLAKECDLGCEGEEPTTETKPALIETIQCNGKTLVVVDKTDLGDQWLVITTEGYPEYCTK